MDVLGYINSSFIEHSKLKIVFIANEDEIKQKKEYLRIREKSVGRVIHFEPDLEEMIPQIFQARFSQYKSFHSLLENKKALIIHLCKRNNQTNLRIISFSLDILRIVQSCSKTINLDAYINSLITFIFLISFEFHAGQLITSKWSDYKKLDDVRMAYTFWDRFEKKEKEKKEKPYYVIFYERYLSDPEVEFEFYKSLFQYILTGYFDTKFFEEEIEQKMTGGKSDPEMAFDKIMDFRCLEMDELSDTLNRVIIFAAKGEYQVLRYPALHSIINHIKNQQYVEDFPEDYFGRVKSGLCKVLSDEQNIPSNHDMILGGFGSPKPSEVNGNEIQDIINKAVRQKNSDQSKQVIVQLLESLNGDDDVFAKVYRETPYDRLFELIYTLQLQDKILDLHNKGIDRFQAILHDRYIRIDNAGNIHYEEKQYMEKLSLFLESKSVQPNFNQMRQKRLLEFVDDLKRAAIHLEQTRKST